MLGMSSVGGLANALGSSMVGEYSRFKHSVASYSVVDNILETYLHEMNASRVGIARFHDNIRDVGGNSQFFVDYESMVTSAGVTSQISDLHDVPAIAFSAVIPKLLDNKPIFLWVKDLPSGSLRELMTRRGDVAMMCIPINDLNDRLVGMVVISWLYAPQVPAIAKRAELLQTLVTTAARIGAYFSAQN